MSTVERIEELEQDLEFYKMLGIKHYERPYAKRYLEEKRKERPNLLYPDSEEIYKDFYEAKEEIERLNNIVNELEKWLAKEYMSGYYEELYRIGIQDSYNKLQELKGSDKE